MSAESVTHADERATLDAWLEANCGVGVPYDDATDEAGMLHGLAYVLRQIEGTNKYMVNIGQTNSATTALRMALDHFARRALASTQAPAPAFPREEVAKIIARTVGGSMYPGLGVPGDFPVDEADYAAADAIASLLQGAGR